MKTITTFLLSTCILAGTSVFAEIQKDEPPAKESAGAEAAPKPKSSSDDDACHHAMDMHKKMAEHMKAMDKKLDDLVSKMNAATGPAKADATAAVVNELVHQRKEMHEMMMKMHHGDMRHMMHHMHHGEECPMMKDSDEEHEHHEHHEHGEHENDK